MSDYTIDLQRIIEDLVNGREIREPKTSARHHYDMACRYRAALSSLPAIGEGSRVEGLDEYAMEYEFRGDGDYTPTDAERTMIEDAICGYLGELSALRSQPEPGRDAPEPVKPMKLEITKEWFEKAAAREGDLDATTGRPEYLPGFVPSAADRYYGGVIAKLTARIAELEALSPPSDGE